MAKTNTTRVIEASRCGADVVRISFERPEGYSFRAGQWFRLTLQTAEGPQTRTFSHATAPGDGWLEIASRLSTSQFKQALASLRPGDEAEISGPGGRLSIPFDIRRVAFLIGGVGITPARGLLRDANLSGRRFDDAALFFGNRDDTCEPYADEMESLAPIGVRIVRVLEHPREGWNGERGMITADLVRRHIDPDDGRLFIVAGPPAMVIAMNSVLDSLGVPQDLRLVESFGLTQPSPAY